MNSSPSNAGHPKDRGFTLIELMVVVLIIAILVAIAIPTFLGQRQTAQDRAAQSNLRNALVTEKTLFARDQVFTDSAAILTALEPSLTWTTDDAGAGGVLPTLYAGTGAVCLVSESGSGTFFWIYENPTTATAQGSGAAAPADEAACAAGAGW
jgi:type IV pilus assembly protein PilA